jgi:putative restriction endonuclease
MHIQSAFEKYLYQDNKEGSGKAASYLRALELLEAMLRAVPLGFEDCRDIWLVNSPERLIELRTRVLEEQKNGKASPWVMEAIPISYLRDGYCSAALTQLIDFLPQYQFANQTLGLLRTHKGGEDAFADTLKRLDPAVPAAIVDDPNSKDGKERIRETKTRIGQHAFREVILEIYENRCCLTGIDLPEVNRASHIIGWAERAATRMDPRNGLCRIKAKGKRLKAEVNLAKLSGGLVKWLSGGL